MKRSVLIACVLLVAGWSFSAFRVVLKDWDVTNSEGLPMLTWTSDVEEGLRHYEVQRQSQSSARFESVGQIDATGAGSHYQFVDRSLFKIDETVEYKLYGVSSDGQHLEVASKHISYSPTAVRRTWGSIKAMFQ